MIEKLRESRGWQLLLVTTLVLVIPLVVDISGRLGILRRMHQEKARLSQELSTARDERDALAAELQFVNDEAYLEQWARVDARLTLPGEVAIIPLHFEQIQASPFLLEEQPSPEQTASSTSDRWRLLFFDSVTAP